MKQLIVNTLIYFQNKWSLPFFIIIISIFCFSSSFSQNLNLSFESIGVEEGLNGGYNYFIKKDSKGIVWISSTEGVFQFDGQTIKSFKADPSNPNSIIDNNIQSSFFEDAIGNIWFSSFSGINVYKTSASIFESFQIKNRKGDLIETGYHIFYIKEEVLWIKAGDEIYTYNIKNGEQFYIASAKGVSFELEFDRNGDVNRIYSSPNTAQAGIEIISKNTDGTFRVDQKLAEHKELPITVYKIKVHNNGQIYILSNRGLIKYNYLQDEYRIIKSIGSKRNPFRDGVFLDENSLLIVGNDGLWLFDCLSETISKYKNTTNAYPLDFEGETISSVYLDHEQQLWMSHGSKAKVSFSWLYNNPFENPLINNGLPVKPVLSLVKDSKERIWTLQNNSIHIFNKQGNLITSQPIPNYNKNQNYDLKESKEGVLFMLIDNVFFEIYLSQDSIIKTKKIARVEKSAFFEPINKNLLLSSSSKGLLSLKRLGEYNWIQTSLLSDTLGGVLHFFKSNKYAFIPTADNSLIVYKYSDDSFAFDKGIKTDFTIYSVQPINYKEKTFILGTDQGLKTLAIVDDEIYIESLYGENEHFYNVELVGEDIWCSTSGGLGKLNGENSFSLFGIKDGLSSIEMPFFSSRKSANDYLWYITRSGVFYFNPDKINLFPYLPKLFVDQIQVQGVERKIQKIYDLKHSENNIKISLRAIGTYRGKYNKIYYRLKGRQDNWSLLNTSNVLNFDYLSPGVYELEMFVENHNGVATEVEQIKFEIDKPFWQKWWFYLCLVLGLGFLVFYIARLYFKRKLKQQQRKIERQELLQKERNRIARELHDDLGSNLSIIKFLSERMNREAKEKKQKENVSKIKDSATEVIEKMSDIIWAMNAENDNLEAFLLHVFRYTYDFFDTYQIECEINYPKPIPYYELSGSKRRNLILVIKESLNNIVKHSGAKNVLIDFQVKENLLEMTIRDNGIGIKNLETVIKGNGLENMKKRIGMINGKIKFISEEYFTVSVEVPLV